MEKQIENKMADGMDIEVQKGPDYTYNVQPSGSRFLLHLWCGV